MAKQPTIKQELEALRDRVDALSARVAHLEASVKTAPPTTVWWWKRG